jgi:hypothetical protein
VRAGPVRGRGYRRGAGPRRRVRPFAAPRIPGRRSNASLRHPARGTRAASGPHPSPSPGAGGGERHRKRQGGGLARLVLGVENLAMVASRTELGSFWSLGADKLPSWPPRGTFGRLFRLGRPRQGHGRPRTGGRARPPGAVSLASTATGCDQPPPRASLEAMAARLGCGREVGAENLTRRAVVGEAVRVLAAVNLQAARFGRRGGLWRVFGFRPGRASGAAGR